MKAREIKSIEPKITAPFSKVKKVIDSFERRLPEDSNYDEIEVPFEYIVGSLFPDAYNNMLQALTKNYADGYIQGREDMKNEIETDS